MYHDRQLKLLLVAGVASIRDNTAFSRIYLVSNNSLQRRIKISPSSFKSHEMELPLSLFLILRVNIFNHRTYENEEKILTHFHIIAIRLPTVNAHHPPSSSKNPTKNLSFLLSFSNEWNFDQIQGLVFPEKG